jgi:hypothetical protein
MRAKATRSFADAQDDKISWVDRISWMIEWAEVSTDWQLSRPTPPQDTRKGMSLLYMIRALPYFCLKGGLLRVKMYPVMALG